MNILVMYVFSYVAMHVTSFGASLIIKAVKILYCCTCTCRRLHGELQTGIQDTRELKRRQSFVLLHL